MEETAHIWKGNDQISHEPSPESTTQNKEYPLSMTKRKVLGYISVILLVLLMVAGDATAQALRGVVPAAQLNAQRYIFQMICILPVIIYNKGKLKVPFKTGLWLTLTSTLMVIDCYLLYEGLHFVPAGTSIAVFSSSLMLASVLFGRAFLKEEINAVKVVAILMSSVGIFLVLQPAGIFHRNSDGTKNISIAFDKRNIKMHDTFNIALSVLGNDGTFNRTSVTVHTSKPLPANYAIGCLVTISSAIMTAATMIIQPLKLDEVNIYKQFSWTIMIGMVICFILTPIACKPVFSFNGHIGMVIANTVVSAAVRPTLIVCLTLIFPTIIASVLPMQVIILYVLQKTLLRSFFPNILHNLPLEITGIIFVVVAAVVTPLFKTARRSLNEK